MAKRFRKDNPVQPEKVDVHVVVKSTEPSLARAVVGDLKVAGWPDPVSSTIRNGETLLIYRFEVEDE